MSNLISYEAELLSAMKVTKQKTNGDEYEVVEIKYKSNGKPFTTSILLSAKDVLSQLQKHRPPSEVALVFEKKGQFNQLVNILPKGDSGKFRTARKGGNSYQKGGNYSSEGMERGNALHCASRIVSALIHKGEVTQTQAASLLLSLAETILTKRSEPEKKEEIKEELFIEVEDITYDGVPYINLRADGVSISDEITF